MRAISVFNQKGGCGKTTTAVNVAAALAGLGKRVLLIDLDPQAHATLGLGCNPDAFDRTIYDVLKAGNGLLPEAIVATSTPLLDLVPCNMLLAGAELELSGVSNKELLLSRCLHAVDDAYDLCVIDCPPSLGLLTLNALVSSSDVIVPVQVQYYALDSLQRLLDTVQTLRDRLHLRFAESICLLLTFVGDGSAFSQQVERRVRLAFGEIVLHTVIHRNAMLAEAPGSGMPILAYAPHSRGAADYKTLAGELLDGRCNGQASSIDGVPPTIPKRLAAIFDRVWIPASPSLRLRSRPGTIETT